MIPSIDKSEVLRYMGHRGQEFDHALDSLIDDVIDECRRLAKPLSTWRQFPVRSGDAGVEVEGTTLTLPGRDIARHLDGARSCALMAVTLGYLLDMAIVRYEHSDLTRSVILDAAATALTEAVCDRVENEIRSRAGQGGQTVNFRFSPGYGDLPLYVQPGLLDVLQTGKRIGLKCSDNLIMLPRKSVSAVVGVFDPAPERGEASGEVRQCARRTECAGCSQGDSCQYRKDGTACGHSQTD